MTISKAMEDSTALSIRTLRELACQYREAAAADRNAERLKLHKASNDLHMIRPVVLIDELPWHEMDMDGELTCVSTDPVLRDAEWYLRTSLYKFRHMPADMVLRPYLPVLKVGHSTGIGISVEEKTLSTDAHNNVVSHEYIDQLSTEEDLLKLHAPVITYDEEETLARYQKLGEAVGDILPVRIVGYDGLYTATWDDIASYRGVTNLLMDLAERPEFMHKIVSRLTDITVSILEQYERLGLFENDSLLVHCTPASTDDLPKPQDGVCRREHVWGRGMAQIFASVSGAMRAEFDIAYMKKTIGQCGLAYYGCCEPLDKCIDVVAQLPNLRKVGVTPWANVDVAAEAINTRFVAAVKPNPALVGVPLLDADALKKEMGRILSACKRNGCSCDIVLKDISTCCGRPENIFEWERIVMDMVLDY